MAQSSSWSHMEMKLDWRSIYTKLRHKNSPCMSSNRGNKVRWKAQNYMDLGGEARHSGA